MIPEEQLLSEEALKEVRTIAIYGDVGSGKTSFAYYLLEFYKQLGRKVYFYKYPNPNLIKPLGYETFRTLEDIESLENSVLYIDEPQLSIGGIYDKKSNGVIAKICSMARQFNVVLIMSSSDTRVFTKHNESYFDLWIVKNMDYDMVKNGSKIKKVIKNNSLFQNEKSFALNKDEFLADCRCYPKINGKHTFVMPSYFTEEYSKPYNQNIAKNVPYKNLNKKNSETKNKNEIIIEEFRELARKWASEQIKLGNIKLEKCEICGGMPSDKLRRNDKANKIKYHKIQLVSHHKQYTYPFTLDDIQIVCRDCHSKLETHKNLKEFKINNPEITDA